MWIRAATSRIQGCAHGSRSRARHGWSSGSNSWEADEAFTFQCCVHCLTALCSLPLRSVLTAPLHLGPVFTALCSLPLCSMLYAPLPCAHCPSALCLLPLSGCPLPLSPVLTASLSLCPLPLCPLPLSVVLTAPLPTASQSCAHCLCSLPLCPLPDMYRRDCVRRPRLPFGAGRASTCREIGAVGSV